MRSTLPLAVATATATALGAIVGAQAAQTCNGHPELCLRRYSDITFVGAHDSPFVGRSLADNQDISVADQLATGVRFLQGQTHREDGEVKLCHTMCSLRDAGPLNRTLTPIKAFLDANPNEVVTLLLTNQDGVDASAYDAVFRGVGLDKYAFAADPELGLDEWPTLGHMIETGKRLVVFMGRWHSDTNAWSVGPSVPYILDEFRHLVETPFEYGNLHDLTFCPVDRPPGANAQGRMLLMNHWLQMNEYDLYIPHRCMAITTNSQEYIMRHVESCRRSLQKTPNFILLDWVEIGDAMSVQDSLNGMGTTMRLTGNLDLAECNRFPDDDDDEENEDDDDDDDNDNDE